MDYFKDEPKFNGVFSRNQLPETIKHRAYIINLDEYKNTGAHWVVLYTDNGVIYFDSFGVEHVPKEIKKFIGNKEIKTNMFRIQAYDSIICDYFYILFIDLMLKGKNLNDFTNLFSPKDYFWPRNKISTSLNK